MAPLLDALHAAQEGADGAVLGFQSQELCVSVGELDVSQLPPAVQSNRKHLPEKHTITEINESDVTHQHNKSALMFLKSYLACS